MTKYYKPEYRSCSWEAYRGLSHDVCLSLTFIEIPPDPTKPCRYIYLGILMPEISQRVEQKCQGYTDQTFRYYTLSFPLLKEYMSYVLSSLESYFIISFTP